MNLPPLVFPKVAEVPEEVVSQPEVSQAGSWSSDSVKTVPAGRYVPLPKTVQGADFVTRSRYNGGNAFTVHEDGFYLIELSPEYAGTVVDKKTKKPLAQPLTAGSSFVVVSTSDQPALWELTITKAD